MDVARVSAGVITGLILAGFLILPGCAAAPAHAPPPEMPAPYVGHEKEVPETTYTRELKHRLDEPGSPPVLSPEEEKRRRNEDIERTVEELY